jgi:hypothetical protein
MLLRYPWLNDAKISHNRGTNTITIQGIKTIRTIHFAKKLNVQTIRPKFLICFDFNSKISNEKQNIMFVT